MEFIDYVIYAAGLITVVTFTFVGVTMLIWAAVEYIVRKFRLLKLFVRFLYDKKYRDPTKSKEDLGA